MNKFCCGSMERQCSVDRTTEKSICYLQRRRKYGINYFDKESYNEIYYCPWCGKQLTKKKYIHSKPLKVNS